MAEHVITIGKDVVGTAKSKREAHRIGQALRRSGKAAYVHTAANYKKFINPQSGGIMATKKTGTAAKPKKAAAKKAAAKKPKGQTVSSGISKAKTVGSAGPSTTSATGGYKGNKKTATAKIGGTATTTVKAAKAAAKQTVKGKGGTGDSARGAKGYKFAGGTNATGGGP